MAASPSHARDRFGSAKAKIKQSASAKRIGAGLMTVALVVIVLNQLFTLDIIANTSGPFSSTIDTIENIGGGALTIVVVGFLVLAGAVAMSFMDQF